MIWIIQVATLQSSLVRHGILFSKWTFLEFIPASSTERTKLLQKGASHVYENRYCEFSEKVQVNVMIIRLTGCEILFLLLVSLNDSGLIWEMCVYLSTSLFLDVWCEVTSGMITDHWEMG